MQRSCYAAHSCSADVGGTQDSTFLMNSQVKLMGLGLQTPH